MCYLYGGTSSSSSVHEDLGGQRGQWQSLQVRGGSQLDGVGELHARGGQGEGETAVRVRRQRVEQVERLQGCKHQLQHNMIVGFISFAYEDINNY